MTRTVRVTLADAPTDVLVFLAQHPDRRFHLDEIARAVAPADAAEAFGTTGRALSLLHTLGYVGWKTGAWWVTVEGTTAVSTATDDPTEPTP